MASLIVDSLQASYYRVIAKLLEEGEEVAPRGMPTKELLHAMITVRHPEECQLPVHCGRGINLALGAVEATQLVAGISVPKVMEQIAPGTARYQDGNAFWGAYGPRLLGQLPSVVELLQREPDTRQAVLTIWRGVDDLIVPTRDRPCTVMLHFMIRDGTLTAATYMRSNDCWLGLPYDIFQFTQLQLTLANVLGLPVREYVHRAGSLHLYEEHVEAAQQVAPAAGVGPTPRGWGRPLEPWEDVRVRARALLVGELVQPQTNDEAWYVEQLHPYTKDA